MTPKVWHLVDREKPSIIKDQACILCGARVGMMDLFAIRAQTVDFELQHYGVLDKFCAPLAEIQAFFVMNE